MKAFLIGCGILLTSATPTFADDWPQWRGPQRDGVWREKGIVKTLPAELKYKWRTRIGAGYAGPAVVGDRVYVTDRVLNKGEKNPENQFARTRVNGMERILCLDANTGRIKWNHDYDVQYAVSYPSGPRATPTVHGGKLYTIGVMGHFFCLDAATGKLRWKKHYVKDFGTEINTWGMASAPLVDGRKVILLVGGANKACVVALDKDSGKEIWRALEEDDPGYAPPVIFEEGRRRQLIIWTPTRLCSLDPESGELYWAQEFASQSGLSITSPIYDPGSQLLFVTTFYNGPLMMRMDRDTPTAKLLWKGRSQSEKKTDGLHAIMCTPFIDKDHIYGVGSYGQLRCLEAKSGRRIWETLKATGQGRWWNAFLVQHGDRTFIINEQGELIIARLSPKGYEEISRAQLIEPTAKIKRRMTVWTHPAFANRSVYMRNDKEIVCVDLAR